MAAPSYTEDLTDITLAENVTGWVALGGGASGLGAGPDFAMEGTNCVDKQVTASEKGQIYNFGSTITPGTNTHFFVWVFLATPGVSNTLALRGLGIVLGTATTAYNTFHVEGSDTYGAVGRVGKCYPIRYVTTSSGSAPYRTLTGSPGANPQYFGATANITGTVKSANLGVDAIRYGTGIYITAGDDVTPATFSGAASANDAVNARWGILSFIAGSNYEMQGRFVIGQNNAYTPTLAYFSDSNKNILLVDTPHSLTDFTQIIVDHASTVFNMTNITIEAAGTNNPGRLVYNNASTVSTLTGCGFIKMGIFTLTASVTATNCIFRSCDTITAPGSNLSGSQVLVPTVAADTGALVWNVATNPDGLLDNMTFSKGTNAHHAIDFGTSVTGNITLRGCEFTGFGSTGDSNDSTVRFLATSGLLTLSLVGCTVNGAAATTSNFSVDDAAGIAVTLSISPVTFSVTAKDLDTGDVIENARVMVPVTSNANFPYNASVTITGSGTTATVTHTTHGRATGDNILIAGATEDVFNGAYTITLDGGDPTNKYTYTAPGTLPASASGSPTATMVLLNGFTNASGVISDSRTYSADQPVSGWVRRHTYGPSYTSATWTDASSTLTKTGAFTGMSGTFLITITAGTNMTTGAYLATWVNANSVTLPGGAGSADSSNVAFTIGAKPFYRQAPVADTISSSDGKSITVFLQPDE
ncbi:MAG: hypothetical protein HYT28_02345 [Parcubacteria group bacterium]|nr:hypothetical protein [Parcubacteria group bacterium]